MVRLAKGVFLTLFFAMFTVPLVIVAGISLNEKKYMFFPPQGVSLRWYPEVF